MLAQPIGLSSSAYLALNGLSGRSWLLDTMIGLAMNNPLVKAGPVAACFAYCWYTKGSIEDLRRRRRILLTALISLLAVLFMNRMLVKEYFLPRPFILSQQVQLMEGDRLVRQPQVAYRVPLTGEMQTRYDRLRKGDILDNDLRSFPSDHAAFFTVLSLGLFFACRTAGAIALLWTAFVILLPRVVTGMHSPADILTGAAIGAAGLVLTQWIAARFLRSAGDWAADLTMRWEGLSAAALSLVLLEIIATLDNLKDLLGTLKDVAERLIGG